VLETAVGRSSRRRPQRTSAMKRRAWRTWCGEARLRPDSQHHHENFFVAFCVLNSRIQFSEKIKRHLPRKQFKILTSSQRCQRFEREKRNNRKSSHLSHEELWNELTHIERVIHSSLASNCTFSCCPCLRKTTSPFWSLYSSKLTSANNWKPKRRKMRCEKQFVASYRGKCNLTYGRFGGFFYR